MLGPEGPRLLSLPAQAVVADCCDGTGWILPEARTEDQLVLQVHLTTLPLSNPSAPSDFYMWTINGMDYTQFSSKKTWEVIRPSAPPKPWATSIWFKGATPRNAFIMWVAHLNRLPTRTRLAAWGMQVCTLCCLCSSLDETRDHLFLNCDFSASIWRPLLNRLGIRDHSLNSWDSLIDWIAQGSTSAPRTLRRIIAHATIYNIWRERNSRLHTNVALTSALIFGFIDKEIRNTINARRHRKQFRSLMDLWMQRA